MQYSLSRFSVSPEQVKAARQALGRLVAAIRKQDPGLVYLVFQERDQPVFFTLASFSDEAVYRRYATSRHAQTFARTILPLCDGKPTFVGLDLAAATRNSVKPASNARRVSKGRKASIRLLSTRRPAA